MGKKYKKKLPIKPPKRIPMVFQCPRCGKKTIKIERNEKENRANIMCGNCGLKVEMTAIPSIFTNIDVYGKFIDIYYSKEINKGGK